MKYRVILTFDARNQAEAAAMVADPERMSSYARMRIVEVDRRRRIKLAALIGGTLAFWLAVGTGLVKLWGSLPR